MIKKLYLIFLLFFSINILAKETETAVFKVIEGQPLDLLKMKSYLENSENIMKQDGIVTVVYEFVSNNGENSKPNVYIDKFKPYAGNEDFLNYILTTIKTWKFPVKEAKPEGKLVYQINTEGAIKITFGDNKNDILKLNNGYFLRAPIDLVIQKNFYPENIVSVFHRPKGFFTKLTLKFTIVFALIIVALLWVTVKVIFNTRKIVPKEFPEFYSIVTKLWENSILTIEENLTMSDANIKAELILDPYSDNIEEEKELIAKIINKIESGEVKSKISNLNLGKYTPDIKLDILKEKLSIILKKLEDKRLSLKKKQKLIIQANSVIWQYYSVPFLEVAITICKKYYKYKAAKIFYAGLQNHITNKFYWYSSNEIDRAVTKSAISELNQMKQGLDWIWTISGIAPMIGLFGTVIGISKSFDAISKASGGLEQSAILTSLAGGINEALYTTIVGLIIGVASIILFYYFKERIDKYSILWEQTVVYVTQKF